MVPVADPAGRKPFLDWVLKAFPDTPKNRAKKWIAAGRFRVNGVIIRKPHQSIVDPGPGLELLGRDAGHFADSGTCQLNRQVALMYWDTSLAIVNKGAGIISVPAPGRNISALSVIADFLAGRLKAHGRAAQPRLPAWRQLHPLPVHRLDEYTSGLFCLALSPAARQLLIQQLRDHSMRREYVAYVEGRPPSDTGTWRNLLRMSADQRRQEVHSKGKAQSSDAVEATTHYEVITEYLVPTAQGCVSKLRLRLETGYKHQIRVQASSAGLPLIGDRIYNPRYLPEATAGDRIEFARQALHSRFLQLEHPERPGKRLSWTADLPKDLCKLEARLRTAET